MKILILGGTGYLGAHLAKALVGMGHTVWAVCRGARCGTSSEQMEADLRARGVRIVHANLFVPGELVARMEQVDFDVIIHGVCVLVEPNAGESLTVRAMQESLALARRCPKLAQFINLSTGLTFSATGLGRVATEESPCHPNTGYGRNMLHAERLLQESGLPWIILRICAVYGGEGSSFDWFMLDRVRRGEMPLPGSERSLFPLVHIEDVVQVTRLVIERGVQRAIFNVASGEETLTLGAIFDCIAAGFGIARPRRIPLWVALAYAWGAETLDRLRGRSPELVPDMIRMLSGDLTLSIVAARQQLGFAPAWPDSLAGIRAAYAEVFAGRAQLFTPPPGRLAMVRGGAAAPNTGD